MKFLVTGAAGFIGSHLVDRLLAGGHQVFGVDNLSNGRIENLRQALKCDRFVFWEADFIHALDLVDDVDVIFHLAALGSVARSIENPSATFQENCGKFHELLCFMTKSRCRRLIYASSSSVLGGGLKTENPQSPYAVSKLTNELYAAQFSKHFGIRTTGLRFFNVYGRRQRPDSPYAAFIPRALNDDPIVLNAPGTQSRDFTYVVDAVEALVCAIGDPAPSGVYGVGYGESRCLLDVVDIVRRLLPERNFNVQIGEPRAGDVLFSNCDNRMTRECLKWTPRFSLESGLAHMLTEEEN